MGFNDFLILFLFSSLVEIDKRNQEIETSGILLQSVLLTENKRE